ncbi:MAG: APC family permease [Meiothermus sp.]|nr:APC family permease [Meiothermus sp.]
MNKLPSTLHWFSALLLISGGFLPVLFSAGWALSEIGAWSLVLWGVVALVGAVQAWVLLELALRFPHKAGGTATYALEVFQGRLRPLAFLSGWGYWLAWTPATALNGYLCANLINGILGTSFNPIVLTLLIVALLYGLNYFGLSKVIFSGYLLAAVVALPLMLLVYIAFQTVTPARLEAAFTPGEFPGWVVLLKWFFVMAWTAYGLEMISSVVAETGGRQTRRMFGLAALWSLPAFAGIPLLLALLIDWTALNQDIFASLEPLFTRHLGPTGGLLLSLMLVGALLYSALAILIPSTRTLYQMADDGLLPPYFRAVNRHGTPQGSLVLDLILNVGLLVIFQGQLVAILATANVGYMVVFVLLPVAYWLYLRRFRGGVSALQYGLIGFLLILNALVLFVGGFAWGWFVFGVGWLLVLVGIPLYYAANRLDPVGLRAGAGSRE